MKYIAAMILLSGLVASTEVFAGQTVTDEAATNSGAIQIVRGGATPTSKGPASNFIGDVTVEMLPTRDTLGISGGYVTFAPGARTAWHSHPQGQMLIVTAGKGRVQQWGGQIIEVQKEDVVWFPPDVKHWHGARPDEAMTHTSLAPISEGKSSNWMEQVTNEQYNGK